MVNVTLHLSQIVQLTSAQRVYKLLRQMASDTGTLSQDSHAYLDQLVPLTVALQQYDVACNAHFATVGSLLM